MLDLEKRLNNLFTKQIPLEKTLLLGFSQGGAMALDIATRIKFQGVFALSSYPHPDWEPMKNMSPIFLCHGEMDDVVPKAASNKSLDILLKNGIKLWNFADSTCRNLANFTGSFVQLMQNIREKRAFCGKLHQPTCWIVQLTQNARGRIFHTRWCTHGWWAVS